MTRNLVYFKNCKDVIDLPGIPRIPVSSIYISLDKNQKKLWVAEIVLNMEARWKFSYEFDKFHTNLHCIVDQHHDNRVIVIAEDTAKDKTLIGKTIVYYFDLSELPHKNVLQCKACFRVNKFFFWRCARSVLRTTVEDTSRH